MKKQKIVYIITQGHWGGAQKYVLDLAVSLSNDFDITVAVGDPNSSQDLQQKLLHYNIKLVQLTHLVRPISAVHDFLAFFELKSVIKKIQPDIVHLNSSKAGILGSLSAHNLKPFNLVRLRSPQVVQGKPKTCKLIYTVHGWVFNEPMANWKKKIYVFLEKITAKLKDKIIVLSEKERQIGIQALHIPESKMSIVPVGIEKPQNILNKAEARTRLKKFLPNVDADELQNTYIIGTVANFYPSKNLTSLIEACNLVKKNIQNFHMILIGDGAERKKLERLISEHNLEKNIHLTGFVDNAAQYLPAFDVFVLSSKKEGLPYSLLEAQAQNIPIITTDVGSVSEIVENQKTGLVVPPEDSDKLADAINYAFTHRDIMTDFAKQSAFSQKFTKENTIKKTISLYQTLLR